MIRTLREELHNLYSTPNIVGVIKSRMRWTEHVFEGDEKCIRENLLGGPEGRVPLRRCRRTADNNIKVYNNEIVLNDVEWIYLAQDNKD
jgi:hypothetical protein